MAWRQVICAFVLLAADSFIATGYSVISVPLGHEFHTSRMMLMLAMTVSSGATALLSPVLGGIMDRGSLRRMMAMGVVLLAIGYALIPYASSFAVVLVIFGVFIAPANILIGPVAATVLLTRWFVERRGRAIGIAIAGVAMGSVVYPPICQWMLDHFAWRDAFKLLALVLLVVSLPAALLVIDRPPHVPADVQPAGLASPVVFTGPMSVRDILSDPSFWLATGIFSIVMAGMIGTITNLVPVALDRGISAHAGALMISVYGLSGLSAKLTFAALADRVAAKTLLSISLTGFAAGMACLSHGSFGYPGLLIGVILVGCFGGLMVPMQSFLAPKIFGVQSVGRAMGCLSMVMLCALLATPPLFGWLADVAGKVDTLFVGFAVIAILAVLGTSRLRLHPRASAYPLPTVAPVKSSV
jgi:MFS family permease